MIKFEELGMDMAQHRELRVMWLNLQVKVKSCMDEAVADAKLEEQHAPSSMNFWIADRAV